MTTNHIKARLIERGIKILDVAREAGVSPTTVSVVLCKYATSKRVQTVIAKLIERPYNEVWGEDNNKKAA